LLFVGAEWLLGANAKQSRSIIDQKPNSVKKPKC